MSVPYMGPPTLRPHHARGRSLRELHPGDNARGSGSGSRLNSAARHADRSPWKWSGQHPSAPEAVQRPRTRDPQHIRLEGVTRRSASAADSDRSVRELEPSAGSNTPRGSSPPRPTCPGTRSPTSRAASSPAPPAPLPRTVDVDETEYSIGLSRPLVGAGQVTFNVHNRGMDEHDLAVVAATASSGSSVFPRARRVRSSRSWASAGSASTARCSPGRPRATRPSA